MALIKCEECGKEISDQSENCPNCGKPNEKNKIKTTQITTINNPQDTQNAQKAIAAIIICIIIGVFVGTLLYNTSNKNSTLNYDTKTIYKIGDKLTCPNFEIIVKKIQIKKKGTSIDSYSVIDDPEWIAVTVQVKNTSTETKSFYTSHFGLINTNGEVINVSRNYYNIWGIQVFDSPEMISGGTVTGFVPFVNTNKDNNNLILTVKCMTGLFDPDIIYKVNLSKK